MKNTLNILIFGIACLPFILPFHFYPDGDFPAQAASLFIAITICIIGIIRSGKIYISYGSIILIALALVISYQQNHEAYPSIAPVILLVGAILAGSVTSLWINTDYQKSLLYGLVAGSAINILIAYIQLAHLTQYFPALIFWDPNDIEATPYGNLAQRNLFTTYVFSGALAAIELSARDIKNRRAHSISIIILLAACPILTTSASRSIFIYIISAILLATIAFIKKDSKTAEYRKAFLTKLCLLLIAMLACQLIITYTSDIGTGLKRVSTGESIRLAEWHKSWIIIYGSFPYGIGWGDYASNSFLAQLKLPNAAQNSTWEHSHNLVVNLIAEIGLLAIPLIGMIAYAIINITRASQDNIFIRCYISLISLHSLLEYPLWYVHFLYLTILIMFPWLPNIAVSLQKTSKLMLSSTLLALAIIITISTRQYIFLVKNVYKDPDPFVNLEKTAEFNEIGANPSLRFAADLSIINHLQEGNGNLRLCKILELTRKLPTYTLLEKMAIELYISDEDRLAAAVLKSRYMAYPERSDQVLKIDIDGFPNEKRNSINKTIQEIKDGNPQHDTYKLEQLKQCKN